ncbi:hypothetical protein [Mumia sp. DW29H23]|uniref:hypothetical protein n=1 Tax=Mumia sp. DW29H23 TaxID=3421241 RepID=UPI003D699ADD
MGFRPEHAERDRREQQRRHEGDPRSPAPQRGQRTLEGEEDDDPRRGDAERGGRVEPGGQHGTGPGR